MNNITRSMLVASALLLNACGSGTDPATSDNDGSGGTGSLSVGITDAAIDEVSAVNLRVLALQLRRQDDDAKDAIEIDLRDPDGNALEFNLLDYQEGETFPLFNDERVPAGVYAHARLVLEAPAKTPKVCAGQDPEGGSHVIRKADGPVPIFVPSGSNNGVKLVSPFRVPRDGEAAVVIDFDLRQALHRPSGQHCYFLRPTFRVEAVKDTGRIVGTVQPSMLDGSNGLCSDDDPMSYNAVYVYRGADKTPGDIDAVDDADDDDGQADPMATATVKLDDVTGDYEYVVGFLSPGNYTLAFTCQADLDRIPNSEGSTDDEKQANDDIVFQDAQNAVVEAGKTTVVPFTFTPPQPGE
ncbi:MAG: DUF4382 domain-containing protein [Gammaproteobacteria bacterium]|nr:DUF4382 domain-containing protein [Gammaproteobacteria bacterium]MDH3534910.1 DUF4382 domain-containing protein [Gammaproteobacteria bacterium]